MLKRFALILTQSRKAKRSEPTDAVGVSKVRLRSFVFGNALGCGSRLSRRRKAANTISPEPQTARVRSQATITHARTAARSRRLKRRHRRGFALADTGFALLLAMIFIPAVFQILAQRQLEAALRIEARQVASIASEAAFTFAQSLPEELAATYAAQNQLREHDIASLMTDSTVSLREVTTRKRQIRLLSYAPSADQLLLLAYASDDSTPIMRAAQSELGSVAWVSAIDPTVAVTEGLRVDLTPVQQEYPDLGAGDVVAIEFLSIGQDLAPYLHRVAIEGRPELNQMEVDLDMGGYAITNVAEISAQSLTVSETLTTSTLTGDLEVSGQASISGDLSVTGAMSVTGSLTVDEAVNAADIAASESLSSTSLNSDTLTANSSTITTMSVASTLTADTVMADQVLSSTATLDTLSGNQLSIVNLGVSGTGTFNSVSTNALNVGSCTGC